MGPACPVTQEYKLVSELNADSKQWSLLVKSTPTPQIINGDNRYYETQTFNYLEPQNSLTPLCCPRPRYVF